MSDDPDQWYRKLVSARDTHVRPVLPVSVLAEAQAVAGPGPVQWAVDCAYDAAADTLARDPALGSGPGDLTTLRRALETAAVRALVCFAHREALPALITANFRATLQDLIRRGVRLETVLATMPFGNEYLTERAMTACTQLVAMENQPKQLQMISSVMFALFNDYRVAVTDEYRIQQEREGAQSSARRAEIVREILESANPELAAAAGVLHYTIAERSHLAAVVTAADPAAGTLVLHRAVTDFFAAVDADETLVVASGPKTLAAWANCKNEFRLEQLVQTSETAVRICYGLPAHGLAGFRESHHQAMRTLATTRICADMGATVVSFEELELLTILLRDPQRAADFRDRQLGGLAADTDQAQQLRLTVQSYLRTHSPQATGEELHLARSSVNYRLKRAERLRGRSLDENPLELSVALAVAGFLGAGPAPVAHVPDKRHSASETPAFASPGDGPALVPRRGGAHMTEHHVG